MIFTLARAHALLLLFGLAACGGGGSSSGGGGNGGSGATLSGSISVPSGVLTDSDVNDVNDAYASNDSLGVAQAVPNPISVAGYVNRPFAGAGGRSFASGDEDDYFEVQCNAGDLITLLIGQSDTATHDLDLYLYDDNGAEVEASVGTGKLETVTAPADGTFYIRATAFNGASNYILTLGAAGSSAAGSDPDALSTRHELLPGEVVVRLREPLPVAGVVPTPAERAAALGLTLAAGEEGRELLLTFDPSRPEEALRDAMGDELGGTLDLAAEWLRDTTIVDPQLRQRLATLKVIKALRRRGEVLSAEPNYLLQRTSTEPNDTYYSLQWHYPQINLPQAWDYTTGDSSVIVSVIDTGVLMGHPDLAGQLTSTGYDFISSPSISNDGNGIDSNPDDPGDSTSGKSSFHGTHCAGTVAARTNNNSGMAGVSWNSRIMPIRVLGVGGGTLYDIVQGIRYSAGLSNDSGITLGASERANIISMSLGGGGYSSSTQNVIHSARSQGVIVIAAAGNESTSSPSYPASYDGVVSVSAVNLSGSLASYSNYGSFIDVAAPGGDAGDVDGDGYADRVWSTCGDDSSGSIQFNYAGQNGTSMATPHVAGVVALMMALDPTLSPSVLDSLLSSGALTNDIGAPGRDDLYGHGLIDALKAVVAVSSGVNTALVAAPSTVALGTGGTAATLTVSKVGSDPISVVSASSDEAWLSVTPDSVDADGLGTYTILADRAGLPDGTHWATVTFTSSLGSAATVQVSLQVQSGTIAYDGGLHYVLLVDGETYGVVRQAEVEASNGSYTFSFGKVPLGRTYLLVAGSDRDNDLYIDNPGEASGAYLSWDQVTPVVVNGDFSGLDFASELNLSISTSSFSEDSNEFVSRFKRLR